MNITFKRMSEEDVPLWQQWIEQPYIKDIWFIEGYEPAEYIHQKVAGNGYDFPFIILLDGKPTGYIVTSDMDAYHATVKTPKGVLNQEVAGSYSLDIFIAEPVYLDKGYGTEIVKLFVVKLFDEFKATQILIDPAADNKRAIRCYEKAGFKFVKQVHDGVTDCHVMSLSK